MWPESVKGTGSLGGLGEVLVFCFWHDSPEWARASSFPGVSNSHTATRYMR